MSKKMLDTSKRKQLYEIEKREKLEMMKDMMKEMDLSSNHARRLLKKWEEMSTYSTNTLISFAELGIKSDHDIEVLLKDKEYKDLIGKRLGHGYSRVTYEHATDPTKVVKIEVIRLLEAPDNNDNLVNFTEYMVWNCATDMLRQYLAPIHWISDDLACMIMEKVVVKTDMQMGDREWDAWVDWRHRAPIKHVITDIKPDNTGYLNDEIVMIDYAYLKDVERVTVDGKSKYREIPEAEIWNRIETFNEYEDSYDEERWGVTSNEIY